MLAAVACFFNPAGFRTKAPNFDRFAAGLAAAGVPLFPAELAFPGGEFSLKHPNTLRVRGRAVMWQKERLLNLAVAAVPPRFTKIAWLDADVLFTNPDWAEDTGAALDRAPVAQLFDTAIRLPKGATADDGSGERYTSFAAVYARQPLALLSGDFAGHGHTGFAWAARRDLFGVGLYDACIAGSGDHMMAHAFAGDWESSCIARILGNPAGHRGHFAAWCKKIYPLVRGRVGCVPGTLLHLWHGDVADRKYVDRNRELAAFGFDPAVDLKPDAGGAWAWGSRKPRLHRWAAAYFGTRKEDGK